MKKFTKALALVLTIALMIPSVAAFAATESPAKTDISAATVTAKTVTYNGKTQTASVTVKLDGKTLKKGTDYTVTTVKKKNAGKYKVTVKGIGNYTGSKTVTWTIKKANQKVTATPAKKTITRKSLKKAKSFTIKVKGNKSKTITYKSSNSKVVKVSKTGKVTVVKNAKKGKYTVTVTVAGTKNYNKAVKKITVTVK